MLAYFSYVVIFIFYYSNLFSYPVIGYKHSFSSNFQNYYSKEVTGIEIKGNEMAWRKPNTTITCRVLLIWKRGLWKKNTEDCENKNSIREKCTTVIIDVCALKQIFFILYSFYLVWDFIPIQLLLCVCAHMCTSVYLYKYLYSWNKKCNKILRSETNLF